MNIVRIGLAGCGSVAQRGLLPHLNKVMRAGFAKTCLDDTGIHEAIAKAIGAD